MQFMLPTARMDKIPQIKIFFSYLENIVTLLA